jgi:hypothetical protein
MSCSAMCVRFKRVVSNVSPCLTLGPTQKQRLVSFSHDFNTCLRQCHFSQLDKIVWKSGHNRNENLQAWKKAFSTEADTMVHVCKMHVHPFCYSALCKHNGIFQITLGKNQTKSDNSTMQCMIFGQPKQPPIKIM